MPTLQDFDLTTKVTKSTKLRSQIYFVLSARMLFTPKAVARRMNDSALAPPAIPQSKPCPTRPIDARGCCVALKNFAPSAASVQRRDRRPAPPHDAAHRQNPFESHATGRENRDLRSRRKAARALLHCHYGPATARTAFLRIAAGPDRVSQLQRSHLWLICPCSEPFRRY